MTTRTGADTAATRDDDPAPDDFGLVVRPIFAGGGSGLPIIPVSTTGVITSVAATNVSTTLLAANTARAGFAIRNTSMNAVLFILQNTGGGVASATNHTVALIPGAYYEDPYRYVGIVIGVWDVGIMVGDFAMITEYTP